MATDYKFQGWLGTEPASVEGKMTWGEFEPKKWTEDDVDIQISHCGICGSDLHQLSSGWGPTPYPCVVGHEIVGKAVRVGSNVTKFKVGDRVGVGAQARSCLEKDCPDCSVGLENHCARASVNTYGSVYPGDEGKSYGGVVVCGCGAYALWRHHGLFSSEELCGAGPGKKVGIVGVGGLGHFGVIFAKALGADRVVGISRKADKREDALALGADEYIATDEDKDWETKHRRSLDLIVCTVSSEKMPLAGYLGMLKTKGTFIQVGAPDGGNLPPISAFTLLANGIKVGGSAIGAPREIEEMLQIAADSKTKPWIQERPLKEANQAIVDLKAGKARYRYVLVNEKHA